MRTKSTSNQTSSQVNMSLLNQFNLKKEERLIDDFSCGFIDKILNKGRMFITESNICFSCDLFGITKKIKIPIRDIKEINKQRYFLIDNGIEIIYFIYNNQGECKESKVLFTFHKRRIVFKRIKDLIISKHNLYASLCDDDIDIDNDDEDEEEDDDIDINIENESYKLNKSNGKSEKGKEKAKGKVKRVFNVSKYIQNKTNTSSNTDKNTNTNSTNSNKINKSLLLNQSNEKEYINLRKDSEFNENTSKINTENTHIPLQLTMTIEEIESVQLVKQGEVFEIPKFTVSTTIQNFLRCFMGNNAMYSQGEYSKTLNRKNINVYDWVEIGSVGIGSIDSSSVSQGYDIKMEEVREVIENNKEKYKTKIISQDENHNESLLFQSLNQPNHIKPKTYIRLYEFIEKVENVPFVSETRIVKYQKLRQINNYFIFSSSTKSMDTPYNEYFTVDENWEVFPYQEEGINKVIIRITYGLVFTKSTYFKSVLDKRVKENYEKDIKTMKNYFEEVSGYEVKAYSSTKPLGKQRLKDLKHGLEKDENKEEEGKEKKEKEEMRKRRNRMKMMRKIFEKDVFYLTFIFILVCYIAYLKDRV